MAAVADAWGSEAQPANAGKTVWFTLPTTDAHVA